MLNTKPGVKRGFGGGSSVEPGTEEVVVVAPTTAAGPAPAAGAPAGGRRFTISDFLKEKVDGVRRGKNYIKDSWFDNQALAKIDQAVPNSGIIGVVDSKGDFQAFGIREGQDLPDALLEFTKLVTGNSAGDAGAVPGVKQQLIDSMTQRGLTPSNPDDIDAVLLERGRGTNALTGIFHQGRMRAPERLIDFLSRHPEHLREAIDRGLIQFDIPTAPTPAPTAGGGGGVPPSVPPNGGEVDWWAESLPFLEDTGITRGQAAWGAGGLAAAVGLAAMLANSGQPQVDPAAYAAYQQSANSY